MIRYDKKKPQITSKLNLRIVILVDILDLMGGAERNIYMLAKGLRSRGHKIMLYPLKGGFVSQRMKQEGFEVNDLNLLKIYSIKGLKTLIRLISIIKQKRASILLTYHESSDFLGFVISFVSGIPIVSNRRDTGFKLKPRHIKIYRFINRYFDHIVANSLAVKKSIIKNQKSNHQNISIIPNGVDLLPTVQNGGWMFPGMDDSTDCLHVCCIANIRPVKGIETLIHAAAIVLKKYPRTRFILVGSKESDKAYYQDLTRQVVELGIGDSLAFTGEVPFHQVPTILSSMDICVLPSLSEGMSNTLLESMLAGKPVVATAVGGNTELVMHGRTGFLVPPKAPGALAKALEQLLSNSTLRCSMGLEARKKVENEFSANKMLNRMESLLKKVSLS